MADHTHIEWADATYNPITGCSVVSPECAGPVDRVGDLTEVDCAYMAGLLDGEGSLYMMKHNGRCGLVTYYPAVSIVMTHEGVMRWFAGRLGLAVARVPRIPVGWREQHSVRIHGKRAVALCARLLPYLKVKREQAALLQAFPFEDRRGRQQRGRHLGADIVAQRQRLRDQVNALNSRGTL